MTAKQRMSAWRKFPNELPDDGADVLCCFEGSIPMCVCCFGADLFAMHRIGFQDSCSLDEIDAPPTYWMPLPERPQ